jgi:hypothetical protein
LGSGESGYILILVPFQPDASDGPDTPDLKHFPDAGSHQTWEATKETNRRSVIVIDM